MMPLATANDGTVRRAGQAQGNSLEWPPDFSGVIRRRPHVVETPSMSTQTDRYSSRKSSGRYGQGIRLNQVNFILPSSRYAQPTLPTC